MNELNFFKKRLIKKEKTNEKKEKKNLNQLG